MNRPRACHGLTPICGYAREITSVSAGPSPIDGNPAAAGQGYGTAMIVADTNMIAYLLLGGGGTALARSVFQRDLNWPAPVLWRSEFGNILAGYIRRGEWTSRTPSLPNERRSSSYSENSWKNTICHGLMRIKEDPVMIDTCMAIGSVQDLPTNSSPKLLHWIWKDLRKK